MAKQISQIAEIIVITFLVFIAGCTENPVSGVKQNIAPETYLSVDSVKNSQSSQLRLRWWGVDPDGLVNGYIFSFDKKSWIFTTKTDSTYQLPIFRPDTSFVFYVLAVDNSVPIPAEGSSVAFVDKNQNGIWDIGEDFVGLSGSVDPTPAQSVYPVKNSPPTVRFIVLGDIMGTSEGIPELTFPVASFQWIAEDIDGNNTITNFYIALNDTSKPENWLELSSQASFITIKARQMDSAIVDADVYTNNRPALSARPLTSPLKGFRLNATNRLFLKAKDVSGSYSNIAYLPGYPDPSPSKLPDTTKTWFVKKPKALNGLLIIDDYVNEDNSQRFYEDSVFNIIGGGRLKDKYDVLDLTIGRVATDPITKRGKLVPAFIDPMFTETLKLFKYIFWYSSEPRDFDIAQKSLPAFRRAGGKVLFSYYWEVNSPPAVDLKTLGMQLRDISEIVDSVSTNFLPMMGSGLIPGKTRLVSRDTMNYPTLIRDEINSNPIDGGYGISYFRYLYPSLSGISIYDSIYIPSNPPRTYSNTVLGLRNENKTFFLMAFPIYRFNGYNKMVPEFFRKVFIDDFGL